MNPSTPNHVNINEERRGLVGALTAPLARKIAPVVVMQQSVRSDEKLFALAIDGNREALGELIGRYEKGLFALLLRLTSGDSHRADDLFQETFLHAMRAGKTFDRKLNFKPWVTAIAVNLVRDEARKKKVRGEIGLEANDGQYGRTAEPASADEGPGESAERRDEELQVQRALQNLTELEREVVLLHFYERMTLAESALVLSVPLGTIKSRLHAALTRLGGLLERP